MAPEDKRWVVGMFDGFDKSSLTYGKPLVDTVLDIATLQKSFSLASREVHPALRNDRADTGIQIPKSKQIAWENIKAAMKECKIEGEGPEKLERKRSGSILRSWDYKHSEPCTSVRDNPPSTTTPTQDSVGRRSANPPTQPAGERRAPTPALHRKPSYIWKTKDLLRGRSASLRGETVRSVSAPVAVDRAALAKKPVNNRSSTDSQKTLDEEATSSLPSISLVSSEPVISRVQLRTPEKGLNREEMSDKDFSEVVALRARIARSNIEAMQGLQRGLNRRVKIQGDGTSMTKPGGGCSGEALSRTTTGKSRKSHEREGTGSKD